MCDGRWTPHTPTRPWQAETPPAEFRPQILDLPFPFRVQSLAEAAVNQAKAEAAATEAGLAKPLDQDARR
jgi:hypothetical protein